MLNFTLYLLNLIATLLLLCQKFDKSSEHSQINWINYMLHLGCRIIILIVKTDAGVLPVAVASPNYSRLAQSARKPLDT